MDVWLIGMPYIATCMQPIDGFTACAQIGNVKCGLAYFSDLSCQARQTLPAGPIPAGSPHF